MKFEEGQQLQVNKELSDTTESESKKNNEIAQEIIRGLDIIRDTKLFEDEYIDNIVLVARDSDKRKYRFKDNEVALVEQSQYDIDDFMQGIRTDFVGIVPQKEFEEHMKKAFEQKRVFEVAFFDDIIAFEEFIAHEMAHNIFDIQYKKKYGEYESDDENKTDVSESYREKIKNIIISLVRKNYPNIEMNKFSFKRQQIAEIFAMLYQREFSRRSGINIETHNKLDKNAKIFFDNPEKMLKKFNNNYDHNFTMEGQVYKENHVLSLFVAKLFEDEYPDWKRRIAIFN